MNLLSLALKGVRWWIFLRPVGAPSLWLALKATFAGAGLNNILVANGGEAARVVFVARAAHVQSAKILATLALERMFELIGYVVLLALSVSFLELPPTRSSATRPIAWVALVGVIALMIFLVRRPEKRRGGRGGNRRRMASAVHLVHEALRADDRRHLDRAAIRRGARSCRSASGRCRCGRTASRRAPRTSTFRSSAPSRRFSRSTSASRVRATPGNVGVFQATYALIAEGFGMDRDQAIAVAFLIQTQQIIPVTLLGVALAPEFIFKRKKVVRADDSGLELRSRPEPAVDGRA